MDTHFFFKIIFIPRFLWCCHFRCQLGLTPSPSNSFANSRWMRACNCSRQDRSIQARNRNCSSSGGGRGLPLTCDRQGIPTRHRLNLVEGGNLAKVAVIKQGGTHARLPVFSLVVLNLKATLLVYLAQLLGQSLAIESQGLRVEIRCANRIINITN